MDWEARNRLTHIDNIDIIIYIIHINNIIHIDNNNKGVMEEEKERLWGQSPREQDVLGLT